MGIFLDEPKFPVIDKTPGFWKVVGNYNLSDYQTLVTATGGSALFGYVVGKCLDAQPASPA